MKSFVAAVMLLAFLMGLGYVPSNYMSKKCAKDPWGETFYKSAKVSNNNCAADPWERALNKSQASQKKYQATEWEKECN
jgi:hypothetical protein